MKYLARNKSPERAVQAALMPATAEFGRPVSLTERVYRHRRTTFHPSSLIRTWTGVYTSGSQAQAWHAICLPCLPRNNSQRIILTLQVRSILHDVEWRREDLASDALDSDSPIGLSQPTPRLQTSPSMCTFSHSCAPASMLMLNCLTFRGKEEQY